MNEQLVEAHCGEKYTQGNGDKRFQWGPPKNRTIVATLGELEFTFQWVTDPDTAPEENTYFRPLDDLLHFYGELIYQNDLSMIVAELATKMSYRDASTEDERFTEMPTKSMINQRVVQFGKQIQVFVAHQIKDTATDTIYPDGTKCQSQDPDRSQHDEKVTLGETDGPLSLLDVTVDRSWADTAASLEALDAVDEEALIVSDGERHMIDLYLTEARNHQLDLRHYIRAIGYKLCEDGELSLKRRQEILSTVESLVCHLRNSVIAHRHDEDAEAIDTRIQQTLDELQELADTLEYRGCQKTLTYLQTWAKHVVRFAKLAVDDIAGTVQWTSNVIERLMGEISKYWRHTWMECTSRGRETILRLLSVRYTSPVLYEAFFASVTHEATVETLTTEKEMS